MDQPETWIGVAVLAVSNVGIWIDKIVSARRRKASCGNGKCKDIGEQALKIVRIEGKQEAMEKAQEGLQDGIKDLRKENREDHQEIFRRLDNIKNGG